MSDAEIFMTESLGSAIIDTACTRTVCGEKWLESYIDDLTQDQVNRLMQTETPSCGPFWFGDGNLVYSTTNVKLPAKIGLTKCQIGTYPLDKFVRDPDVLFANARFSGLKTVLTRQLNK